MAFISAAIAASGSAFAAAQDFCVAATKRRTRSGLAAIVASCVRMVSPTVLMPFLAKPMPAGLKPFCLTRKNWSSSPPSMASTRFSNSATTLPAGSICTSVILPVSSLLKPANAGKSCVSASPAVMASFLPSRSFGVRMPVSASEMTPKLDVLSSDITVRMPASFDTRRITDEELARPNVSVPAATT